MPKRRNSSYQLSAISYQNGLHRRNTNSANARSLVILGGVGFGGWALTAQADSYLITVIFLEPAAWPLTIS